MSDTWNDDADRRALGPPRSSARLLGLFATLVIVLVTVLVLRQFVSRQDAGKSPAVGKALDTLELVPLEGEGEKLTAESLQGKVSLINFWGPWCPPCRMEFPELIELRERMAGEAGFQFISVTCMHDENEGDLVTQTKTFLASKKYDLPVYRDPQLVTRRAVLKLNEDEGFAYPTTLLVDQKGVVRGVWIGYTAGIGEKMRGRIAELLAASKGSAP